MKIILSASTVAAFIYLCMWCSFTLTKKLYIQLIQDIGMIRARLGELERKFGFKPIVVITEKVIRHNLCCVAHVYEFHIHVFILTY